MQTNKKFLLKVVFYMINFQGFAKVYWLTGVEVGPSPYTSEITGAYVTYSGKRLVMY